MHVCIIFHLIKNLIPSPSMQLLTTLVVLELFVCVFSDSEDVIVVCTKYQPPKYVYRKRLATNYIYQLVFRPYECFKNQLKLD
jgi:hypothetical protein